ncbi:MAG TPA: hypothetical protein VEY10_19320 [Flavisolibacter sp.]|jgi:hypothetical protein|nr:hypothetical protein [Flavisolibacter sp.]
MTHPEEIIPNQEEGAEVNVEDSVVLQNETEAASFYTVVKERLVNINGWGKLAGALSAEFALTDDQGKEIDSYPRKGNYFKINIPAPGIITGEGYDWVQIEEVQEEGDGESESIAIRVRPASSPVNDKEDVAHFLTDEATSNFIVKRQGAKITAGVYGRNEKPNVKADTLLDKARNAIVGTGAVSGLAKLQWKGLVNGLLEKE